MRLKAAATPAIEPVNRRLSRPSMGAIAARGLPMFFGMAAFPGLRDAVLPSGLDRCATVSRPR